jgi:hypothetical protein
MNKVEYGHCYNKNQILFNEPTKMKELNPEWGNLWKIWEEMGAE